MTRLLLVMLLLSGLPATAGAATRTYIVTDFDSIRLEAPIDVVVETKRGISARGEGDSDMLERVELTVSARVLTIRLKPAFYERRRGGGEDTARLVLTAPALRRIHLSGAGTLNARGLARGNVEIASAGSGNVSVTDIDSDTLGIAQFGSGSVRLAGKVKSALMRVSGSGAIDAKALGTADLDLQLNGTANVAARADRAAKIVVTGSGNVTVDGKGACRVNHAGSGVVRCGGDRY